MLATLPVHHRARKTSVRGPERGPSGSRNTGVRMNWNDQVILGYRPSVRAIRRFTVRPVLPPALSALGDLAGNLRWSWHPPTQDVFAEVDPETWEATKHDPVRLLGAVGPDRLEELAADQGFLDRLGAAKADLDAYLGGERWYGRKAGDEAPTRIAYFSPEFGITAVLPQYSGGLGILAGDHLKAASDLGVPARRRRPALPRRLLQAVALPRGLAARAVPRPRPRRAADLAAPRDQRRPRADLDRPARRPRPARQDLGGAGRPGAAAAARLRRRGQPRPLPRGHRPSLRRHLRAPAAPGDPARHRRRARPARPRPDHRRVRARGVPHQRGPRRLPRPRADPRADRRGERAAARLRHRARGLPRLDRLHHPHPGAGRHRPVLPRAGRAVLRLGRPADRRPDRPDPRPRRRGLRRWRPDGVQHGGDGLPARPACERRLAAARPREPGDVPRPVARLRRGRGADHLDHQRRARPDLGRPRGLRPRRPPRRGRRRRRRPTPSGPRSTRRRRPTSGRSSGCCASGSSHDARRRLLKSCSLRAGSPRPSAPGSTRRSTPTC